MYTVYMGRECACFKKSEYEKEKSFDNQRDAYNYSNVLAELMNEKFCTTHIFSSHKTVDDDFIIGVVDNPDAGGCSTGSCGPCGC